MRGFNIIWVYGPGQDKVLMCLRRKPPYRGLYNLVGGKIEPGEAGEADRRGDENSLVWMGLEEDFFDMNKFAGEGNIGHIYQIVKINGRRVAGGMSCRYGKRLLRSREAQPPAAGSNGGRLGSAGVSSEGKADRLPHRSPGGGLRRAGIPYIP